MAGLEIVEVIRKEGVSAGKAPGYQARRRRVVTTKTAYIGGWHGRG